MKVLSAHQPSYAPYAGLWNKYISSDIFVWLDDVQYEKNGWQNRNKVRNAEGWQWLTVPVYAKLGTSINDIELADNRWSIKHAKTISMLYSKAKYADRIEQLLSIYDMAHKMNKLIDVIMEVNGWMKSYLNSKSEEHFQSSIKGLSCDPDYRLIDLCKLYSCDTYLSGCDGRHYMDLTKWDAAGINVMFQDVHMHEYAQVFPGWESNMCFIDTIANVSDVNMYVKNINGRSL